MSGRAAATGARRAAFEVLRRVFEHDAWADRAFDAAAERHGLDQRGRAQAQWLAFGSVQRRGTTDAVAAGLTGRTLARLDAPVVAALRLGLFELFFAGDGADHAAVDGAVELAKGGLRRRGDARARAGAGLVNAVLRRAIGERDELLAALGDERPADAAIAHSLPDWLADMWWEELGASSARSLMRACNEPPETALRVNPLRADPTLAKALISTGEVRAANAGAPTPLRPSECLVATGALGTRTLAALAEGALFAQSRGAQAVVELLGVGEGERVLDVCAGPGVKTVAAAARIGANGSLRAIERDPGRARQIEELCARAGVVVAVQVADAAEGGLGEGYDRVLVDPPCSDLGTLASRPDARWRKSPGLIGEVVPLQRRILARAASALRPGGTLVYSTCTVSRCEGEEVVGDGTRPPGLDLDDLGALHPQLASSHDGRCLQLRPDRDGTDGFFIARMRRVAG